MTRKKLTLSVDEAAIRRARRFSERHGTSISSLVSDFLASLGDEPADAETRIVSRLRGILPPDADQEAYRKHLLEKYRG